MSALKDIYKDNMRASFLNVLSSKRWHALIRSVCEALSLAETERMAWKRNACASLPLSVSLLNARNRSGYLPIYMSLYINSVSNIASSHFISQINAKNAQIKVFIYANSTKCLSNAARMARLLNWAYFDNIAIILSETDLKINQLTDLHHETQGYLHTHVRFNRLFLHANSCSYALLDFLRAYTNYYSYTLMRGVKISQSDALQKRGMDADILSALYTSLSGMRIETILAERKSCVGALYRMTHRCPQNTPANARLDERMFVRIAIMILCPQNTPANTRLTQGVRTQFALLINCTQNVPANECLLRAKRSNANDLQTCTENEPANIRLHEPRTRFVKSMIACPQNIPANGCMQTCDCSIQTNLQACTEIGTVHNSVSRTVAAAANSRRNCVDMRTGKRGAYDAAVALRFTQAHCATMRTVCIDARDAKYNFLPTQSCCLNNRTVSFTHNNTTCLGEVA